jgi:hypothetical protein
MNAVQWAGLGMLVFSGVVFFAEALVWMHFTLTAPRAGA